MIHPSEAKVFLSGRTEGPNTLNYAVTLSVPSTATSPPRQKVIGLLGSKLFPTIGYLFHPEYHGKGYATEALMGVLPVLWEWMPAADQAEGERKGYDYVEAKVDAENPRSMRVVEKAGFVRGELIKGEYTSPQLGLRDCVPWKLARPGTTLRKDLGISR